MTSTPWEAKTVSKPAADLPSRSRMRDLTAPGSPSCRCPLTWRACWVTRAASGAAVHPARWTRREPSSMKKGAHRRTVSTVKKSQATMYSR
jgi:hypothetical protein